MQRVVFVKKRRTLIIEGLLLLARHWEWGLKVTFSSFRENCNLHYRTYTDRWCHLVALRPFVSRGSPKDLHNFIHSFYLILAWEERSHHVKFHNDAGKCKNIDRRTVGPVKKQFRRSVPSRWNILGVGRPRPNLSGEAKVANFDIIIVKQYVFWFEVAVEVAVLVQVGQPSGNFEEYCFNLMFC